MARRFVMDRVRAQGVTDETADEAMLLTSELATNAVQHARSPFTVELRLTDDSVRISVCDREHDVERLRRPVAAERAGDRAGDDPEPTDGRGPTGGPYPSRGRGLFFVAVLSWRWGVDELPDGKAVWFELPR